MANELDVCELCYTVFGYDVLGECPICGRHGITQYQYISTYEETQK